MAGIRSHELRVFVSQADLVVFFIAPLDFQHLLNIFQASVCCCYDQRFPSFPRPKNPLKSLKLLFGCKSSCRADTSVHDFRLEERQLEANKDFEVHSSAMYPGYPMVSRVAFIKCSHAELPLSVKTRPVLLVLLAQFARVYCKGLYKREIHVNPSRRKTHVCPRRWDLTFGSCLLCVAVQPLAASNVA